MSSIAAQLAQFVRLRVLRSPEPDNNIDLLAERVAGRLAIDPADLPTAVWIGKGVPPTDQRNKLAVRLNDNGTIYGFGIYTGNVKVQGCCSEGGWQWSLANDDYRITPGDIPEGYRSTDVELAALSSVQDAIDAVYTAIVELRDWAQSVAPKTSGVAPPLSGALISAMSKLQTARQDLGKQAVTVVQNTIL